MSSGRGRGGARDASRSSETTLLQPKEVQEDKYFLLFALVSRSATRSRLLNIHRLLSNIVSAVRGVVKGTESQRRFNAEFAQFCKSALVGLADLEDAVFELRHPGRRAADASDDEVLGIAEADFFKEVAAFTASQTQALTAQYLELVATSAVGKAMKQQQQQQGGGSSASASTGTKTRGRKRERTAGDGTLDVGGGGPSSGAGSGIGGGHGKAAEVLRGLGEEELGLLDERELLERAAQRQRTGDGSLAGRPVPPALTSAHLASPAGGRTHPVGAAADGKASKTAAATRHPDGVFVSADGRAYDLGKAGVKLAGIEELGPRMEPWKLPQPYTAVELERVTVEKEKRMGGKEGKDHSANLGALTSGTTDEDGYVPLLDVCLAQTPAELFRGWESREAALAAALGSSESGSGLFSSGAGHGGRRPKRHSTNPHDSSGQPQQRSPPLTHASSRSSVAGEMSPFSGETGRFPGVDVDDGQHRQGGFFPSLVVRASVSVPTGVMRELVHNGVSSIEFLYDT